MAIALALMTAIVYGASDFLGGLAGRRTPTFGAVLWAQCTGMLVLAAVLPFLGRHAVASDLGWGAISGLAGVGAIGMLYRGLAIGTMGIVSPISAVLGATIPLVYGVALRGEHPTWLADSGIAAALAAVVCVSGGPGSTRSLGLPPGIAEGLLAGAGFGAYFILLAQTHAAAGLVPLLAARVASVIVLVLAGLAFGGPRNLLVARSTVVLIVGCGVLDITANVLYVIAVHSGPLALVAVLSSLYPAATVALAAVVLRERLQRLQWIGVALALGGAAAIAGGS